MADRVTESKVINVRVEDNDGNGRTFKLDNPKRNISFAMVKNAINPIFTYGWWINDVNGNPYTKVASVTGVTTEKIYYSDTGTQITVSPSEYVIEPSVASGNNIFTVTGSKVLGAYPSYTVASGTLILTVESITNSQVTMNRNVTAEISGLTGTLYIITEAQTISIPIRNS